MSALSVIRQTARGAAIIADWFGEGGQPVSQELANARAKVCAVGNEGSPCPLNTAPRWWEKATGSIATAIRDMIAVKNEVEMAVRSESTIHMCKACGCCLKLKVWVPLKHVKKSFDAAALLKTPPYCWARKEITGT